MIGQGWPEVPLSELGYEVKGNVQPVPGRKYELFSVPAFPSGRPEILDGADIGSGKRPVRSGDLLICKINPRINRVWSVSPSSSGLEQLASTEFLTLRPHDGDPILLRYLIGYLRSPRFRSWIRLNVEGATGSHTRAKSGPILAQAVPLAPPDERRIIVDEIEKQFTRLDAATTGLQRVRINLRWHRATVLREAITGRLTSSHAIFRQGPLASVPDGWDWVALSEVADVSGGLAKSASRKTSKQLIEVPYLRVANVQRGYLDLGEMKTILATEDEILRLGLRPGDVLFNEGGDRDKLGRGWIWEGQVNPCIHQNHVFRARPKACLVEPKFLSWYGNTVGAAYFFEEGKQTTNLASVSLSKLRLLPVPVPPRHEQEQIIREIELQLTLIEHLERDTARAMSRGRSLRESILAAAFSGRLPKPDGIGLAV